MLELPIKYASVSPINTIDNNPNFISLLISS